MRVVMESTRRVAAPTRAPMTAVEQLTAKVMAATENNCDLVMFLLTYV
jgi:hypothetical protein